MSRSVIDLSEHMAEGLLWVQTDGRVRHANRAARRRTALRAGDRLDDVALVRAALRVARTGRPRPGALILGDAMLPCQVLPGLNPDDAFVLLSPCLDGATDAAEPHALAALGAERESLLRGVERLVDPGELRTRADVADHERIELWPLLQQAWSEVEPQALERRVGVCFRGSPGTALQATLYGSRRWLTRALAECLAAAVAATPAGGQFEVRQLQCGDRARVLFRTPSLFAGAAEGGLAAVALRLCRVVLAMHGGSIGPEDGGWALTLPTGAPARPEAPACGITPLPVHARDLAASMNGPRGRGARPGGRGPSPDDQPADLP